MRTSYNILYRPANTTEQDAVPVGSMLVPVGTTSVGVKLASGNVSNFSTSGGGGSSLQPWQANTVVEAGEVRRATLSVDTVGIGDFISSNTARTTGATFNSAELLNWTELPNDPDLLPIKDTIRAFKMYINTGDMTDTVRYYKVGTISDNNGQLAIQGLLSGHTESQGRGIINIAIAQRDNFRVQGSSYGVTSNTDIVIYNNAGVYTAYIKAGDYSLVNIDTSVAGGSVITWDGTYITTTPTGTLAFTLSSDAGQLVKTNVAGDLTIATTPPIGDNSKKIATTEYVVNLGNTHDYKSPVRTATTAALPAHTMTGMVMTASANAVLAAQDGVTLVANDRILVKNETIPSHNGIYVVTNVGSASTPWVMTRSADADGTSELNAMALIGVSEGTANAKTYWNLTNTGTITIGTTSLTFTQTAVSKALLDSTTASANVAKKSTIHVADTNIAITEALHSNREIHLEGTGDLTIAPADITTDTFGCRIINTGTVADTLTPGAFDGMFIRNGNDTDLFTVLTINPDEVYDLSVTNNGGFKFLNAIPVSVDTRKGYSFCRKSSDQASVVTGTDITFDVNVGTLGFATNSVTLKAGKTYKITASVGATASSVADYTFKIVDSANTSLTAQSGGVQVTVTNTSHFAFDGTSVAIETPATDKQIKVRVTYAGASFTARADSTWLMVEEL